MNALKYISFTAASLVLFVGCNKGMDNNPQQPPPPPGQVAPNSAAFSNVAAPNSIDIRQGRIFNRTLFSVSSDLGSTNLRSDSCNNNPNTSRISFRFANNQFILNFDNNGTLTVKLNTLAGTVISQAVDYALTAEALTIEPFVATGSVDPRFSTMVLYQDRMLPSQAPAIQQNAPSQNYGGYDPNYSGGTSVNLNSGNVNLNNTVNSTLAATFSRMVIHITTNAPPQSMYSNYPNAAPIPAEMSQHIRSMSLENFQAVIDVQTLPNQSKTSCVVSYDKSAANVLFR